MDDFWNPGEMGVAEREMKKVNGAHFVLLPVTEATRGHYTFFQAARLAEVSCPAARGIKALTAN